MPRFRDCAGGCGEQVHYNPAAGGRETPTCRVCRARMKAAGELPPGSKRRTTACEKCRKGPSVRHRACEHCSANYHPVTGDKQRFCSQACFISWKKDFVDDELSAALKREQNRRKNMRRRGYKVATDNVPDIAIFERDDWICRLCGEQTDREVPHFDRRAPTIDHIVPLSLGGDDTAANKQTAHRSCNSRKGGSNSVWNWHLARD